MLCSHFVPDYVLCTPQAAKTEFRKSQDYAAAALLLPRNTGSLAESPSRSHRLLRVQVAADLAGSSGDTAAAAAAPSTDGAPAPTANRAAVAAAVDADAADAGGAAAAAEVADAARRLRMDPQLAARAQAELRMSKPQVEHVVMHYLHNPVEFSEQIRSWLRGARRSCASASRGWGCMPVGFVRSQHACT